MAGASSAVQVLLFLLIPICWASSICSPAQVRSGQPVLQLSSIVSELTASVLEPCNQLEPSVRAGITTLNFSSTVDSSGNCNMPLIPVMIISDFAFASLKGFSSLTSILLGCNSLKELSNNSFANLPKLQTLEVQHNQLSGLVKSQFAGLQSLKKLNLMFNEIESIAPGAFEGLNQLTLLDLSNNFLLNIKPGVFDGLPSLNELKLFNNELKAIQQFAFANLSSSLQTLNLNGNWDIHYIGPHAFPDRLADNVLLMTPSRTGSNCKLNSTAKQIECDCAIDPFTVGTQNLFPGGKRGRCVCAPGQFLLNSGKPSTGGWQVVRGVGVPSCFPCVQGYYTDTEGSPSECLSCPGDSPWTADIGTNSSRFCAVNPRVRAAQNATQEAQKAAQEAEVARKAAVEAAVAQKAEDEAQINEAHADRDADSSRKLALVVAIGSSIGVSLLLCGLCLLCRVLSLKSQLAQDATDKAMGQQKEINYLRDWQIKQHELVFVCSYFLVLYITLIKSGAHFSRHAIESQVR